MTTFLFFPQEGMIVVAVAATLGLRGPVNPEAGRAWILDMMESL
jgi:hypothetical protein